MFGIEIFGPCLVRKLNREGGGGHAPPLSGYAPGLPYKNLPISQIEEYFENP